MSNNNLKIKLQNYILQIKNLFSEDQDGGSNIIFSMENIENYVKRLFEYLSNKYCFTSGAFVIEDEQQKLVNYLQSSALNHYTSIFKIGATHTTYMNKTKSNEDEYIHQIKFKNPITIKCQCEDKSITEVTFTIIKWYHFINNGKNFIYMKPETFATLTFAHLGEAIQRYGFHNEKKSCRDPRREDCKNDKNGCKFVNNDILRNYTSIIKEDGSSEQIIETYNRIGDEMFIPHTILEHILSHIHTNVNYKIFEESSNTIKLIKPSINGNSISFLNFNLQINELVIITTKINQRSYIIIGNVNRLEQDHSMFHSGQVLYLDNVYIKEGTQSLSEINTDNYKDDRHGLKPWTSENAHQLGFDFNIYGVNDTNGNHFKVNSGNISETHIGKLPVHQSFFKLFHLGGSDTVEFPEYLEFD